MKRESFQETELLQGDSNTVALKKDCSNCVKTSKEETRGWEHQCRDGENQDSSNTQPLPALRHGSRKLQRGHGSGGGNR